MELSEARLGRASVNAARSAIVDHQGSHMYSQQQLTRWLTITSFIAVCLTVIVIGLGVFTRLSDAGLGCPDWPACYGRWVVPKDAKAMRQIDVRYPHVPIVVKKAQIEMGHRYIAGALGVLIMVVATLCAMTARYFGSRFLFFSLGLFGLFIYQALLGMWTVTLKLWPVTVSQHLLTGMLLLCLLWFVYLCSRERPRIFRRIVDTKKIRLFAVFSFFILFLQIFLGGWTSSNYAGLICHGFPACHALSALSYDFKHAFRFMLLTNMNYDGGVLSDGARMTIQMMHRFGALVVAVCLFILVTWIHVCYADNKKLVTMSRYLLFFFCVQIVLGILNVMLQLPILIAVLHNLIAAIILLFVVTINYHFSSSR